MLQERENGLVFLQNVLINIICVDEFCGLLRAKFEGIFSNVLVNLFYLQTIISTKSNQWVGSLMSGCFPGHQGLPDWLISYFNVISIIRHIFV